MKDEAAAFYWPAEQEDKSKMVMPGDNVEMECEIYNALGLELGQRFNVREVSYNEQKYGSLLTCYLTRAGGLWRQDSSQESSSELEPG